MPKQATKAADNAFYKARIAASKCNDRLASREGASEELGIDRTRLARIELGSLNPYPEEVLLMADYGSLNDWLTTQIEAQVKTQKDGVLTVGELIAE